jgi:hypothetical protein
VLLELAPPGIVAAGILGGALVVSRGAALSAWWTLHAGAGAVGVSIVLGAAVGMSRSPYPAGAVLSSAFLLAAALLGSATIMGDPRQGAHLVPIWGVGGGFLLLLLPRHAAVPAASGWALLAGTALLSGGVLIATVILAD